MYWLTSSVFSLSQILLLKIPGVRAAFKIPPLVKHPVTNTDGAGRPGSGLMKQIKDCEWIKLSANSFIIILDEKIVYKCYA